MWGGGEGAGEGGGEGGGEEEEEEEEEEEDKKKVKMLLTNLKLDLPCVCCVGTLQYPHEPTWRKENRAQRDYMKTPSRTRKLQHISQCNSVLKSSQ